MSLSMEMKLGTQGTAKIEETVDLFDFGVPVKVSPPPPSEITEIGTLTQPASPSPTG